MPGTKQNSDMWSISQTGSKFSRAKMFFTTMDYWLLGPVLLMVIIGLYALNAVGLAGVGTAMRYPWDFYKQIVAVLIGMTLMLVICLLEPPTLRLFGNAVYIVSVLLLFYVKVDGYSLKAITGADSWFNMPFVGSFQPSELAKVGIAMVGGFILREIQAKKIKLWMGVLRLAVAAGVPLLLVMSEPDFGTSMAIVFMVACMIFVAGINWRYIVTVLVTVVVALPLVWNYVLSGVGQNRILTFLFPGHDKTASYHITKSLEAVSRGGLVGSVDSPVHVPVKDSDFIFTAIAERMGLVGVFTLVVLVIVFVLRALFVASKVGQDNAAQGIILTGLISVMAIHYVENMGMSVGLLPITGIPLPFISNGGSAMVCNFISLGVILHISMNRRLLLLQTGNYR